MLLGRHAGRELSPRVGLDTVPVEVILPVDAVVAAEYIDVGFEGNAGVK